MQRQVHGTAVPKKRCPTNPLEKRKGPTNPLHAGVEDAVDEGDEDEDADSVEYPYSCHRDGEVAECHVHPQRLEVCYGLGLWYKMLMNNQDAAVGHFTYVEIFLES